MQDLGEIPITDTVYQLNSIFLNIYRKFWGTFLWVVSRGTDERAVVLGGLIANSLDRGKKSFRGDTREGN